MRSYLKQTKGGGEGRRGALAQLTALYMFKEANFESKITLIFLVIFIAVTINKAGRPYDSPLCAESIYSHI